MSETLLKLAMALRREDFVEAERLADSIYLRRNEDLFSGVDATIKIGRYCVKKEDTFTPSQRKLLLESFENNGGLNLRALEEFYTSLRERTIIDLQAASV